jgi:hypothetical protein
MQEAENFLFANLRFRHQAVWREAHGQDLSSCLKKSVAYHNWFALPERPVSDACAPFVLPEYLKMALSKKKNWIVGSGFKDMG